MNKILNSKSIAVISIAVAGLFVSFAFLQEDRVDAEIFVEQNGIAKAVIIDQLSEDIPNVMFQQKATGYLEDAGYQVDLFTTEDITVDFYKNLPKMNYDYVVIRTHGATDDTNSDVVLFTGERYTTDKYISDQLFGQVTRATPLLEISYKVENDLSNWVEVNSTYSYLKVPAKPIDETKNEFFAITPKFVQESMEGKFSGTTFILGGCKTLENPSIAESLIERGASAVLGWDDTVGSMDNDYALLLFLESTLVEDMDIDQTLDIIQKNIPTEKMPYPANLVYYTPN